MKKYSITKAKCQSMIKGVCSRCGGKLTPIETVNNSKEPTFWSGCEKCQTFDWGVKKRIWKIARKMVRKFNLQPYDLDEFEYRKEGKYRYWLNSQTSGVTTIVQRILTLNEEIK